MNRKKRERNKVSNRPLYRKPSFVCNNCGEYTSDGHFMPPSLGDPGEYACKRKRNTGEQTQ